MFSIYAVSRWSGATHASGYNAGVTMVAVMNTLAIYEQFRTVLGEERAKSFAETIGTMIEDAKNTATKEDFRILRESADANAARLEAALARLAESHARSEDRLVRLEQTVQKLADAQARTEVRVEGLAEAQARTEARLDRLEETVQKLAEAQARTETKLEQLIEIVTKLVIRSDRHEGDLLELKFRDRLPSYLGRLLRKAKVIEAAELIDAIEPTVGEVAVDDFLRSDVVATGTLNGSSVYLIGEISYTANEDDVMRAARRTACLVKAGLPAVGLVACEKISPQTAEYASKEGVRVWLDGRMLDAESPPRSPAA
jgi:hypothetical protein